ncbi:MAG: glycosyltransferase family 4 protein [Hydrogenophilales bacterium]|nr:glycosyltransferase family 4 protein [Hydrogenophilales bacterium]
MKYYYGQARISVAKVIQRGLGNADGVYTFNGAGLELMQYARSRGLRTVMEQTIAPMEIERQLLAEEQKIFPGWQEPEPDDEYVRAYIAREQAEWCEADVILCGSEFVREGIAACGGPVERCVVVPYGLAKNHFGSVPTRSPHNGPLRVLTVGAVGLRKGSPYVLEAAKLLKGRASFRMVGPLGFTTKINDNLSGHIELVGPVPRASIQDHFAWADIFLLPSLCEGSATVTYEALANGLPVICTPNTGSIVRDGIEGAILCQIKI